MATDVPMPKLGLTMEEATILQWLVADGEAVAADSLIVLIETDKTETEVVAPGAGRLVQFGKVGEVFKCGERIGVLLADGEELASVMPTSTAPAAASAVSPPGAAPAPGSSAASVPAPTDGRLLASPNARRVAAERGIHLAAVAGTGPDGRIVSEDVESHVPSVALVATAPPAVASAPVLTAGGSAVATAAARQLADLLGIDLRLVEPDPVEHAVTRNGVARHVRQLLQQLVAPAATAPSPSSVPAASSALTGWPLLQEPTRTIRLSGMRGTIAKRMHGSLRDMAQLTLSMDAEMSAVLADRAARKGLGTVPSITDYVVAAAARALLRHPHMNAQVTADGVALLPEVHVGLAVAVEGGLLVPVVRDAAHRELADLAGETMRLAAAARSGALQPTDLEGGTFSVSALGAFGVDMFTPVINPPNAGILGIGRLRDDVVLDDGAMSTRKRLTLSLSWDHRVLDGVPAAEFCRAIVELLADPALLE